MRGGLQVCRPVCRWRRMPERVGHGTSYERGSLVALFLRWSFEMGEKGPIQLGNATTKEVSLAYVLPEDVRGAYANHMLIQQDGDVTYLSFFHAPPPFISGTTEQISEQLANMSSIKAKLITQLIVPKSQIRSFANALVAHADRTEALSAQL